SICAAGLTRVACPPPWAAWPARNARPEQAPGRAVSPTRGRSPEHRGSTERRSECPALADLPVEQLTKARLRHQPQDRPGPRVHHRADDPDAGDRDYLVGPFLLRPSLVAIASQDTYQMMVDTT